MRNITIALLFLITIGLLTSGCNNTEHSSSRLSGSNTISDNDDVPYMAKQAMEKSKVEVITIDGEQLLYVPDVSFSGNRINITHRFYKYENGKMIHVLNVN